MGRTSVIVVLKDSTVIKTFLGSPGLLAVTPHDKSNYNLN